MTEALIGLAVMMVLAFLRLPIALSMGVVGVVGYAFLRDWNWNVAFAMAQTKIYETGRNYTLSVIPLFILLGSFITRAGLSQELFRAAHAFIGHLRGGLAMASVVACAGFGSICGSSVATAATMAKVCYPPMKKLGYSDALSTGSIAAGGTLGILIPPSTLMVIYGIMTETNIGKLFAAGMLPGLLATILLCLAVAWVTWRDPKAGPPAERMTWGARWATLEGMGVFTGVGVALTAIVFLGWLTPEQGGVAAAVAVMALALVYRGVTSVLALFVLMMGGIYVGVFTATEAAGIGTFVALIIAVARRSLSWRDLYQSLVESARTTSMVLLTLPIFFPIVVHLGFDPVWFGILIVVVVEIGLISPPVGMNLFVLSTLLPEVPTRTVFKGVIPFVVVDCLRLAILVAFPWLSLWLPQMMK